MGEREKSAKESASSASEIIDELFGKDIRLLQNSAESADGQFGMQRNNTAGGTGSAPRFSTT